LGSFNLDVRGKSVLLKPNIVEYIPGRPVNTDTQFIGAAAQAFLRLDAASVTVGEGPGHHRDTKLLLNETGLGDQLAQRKIRFVDLNRDELVKTKVQANSSGLGYLGSLGTVLVSDFIVSMPKVKAHALDGKTNRDGNWIEAWSSAAGTEGRHFLVRGHRWSAFQRCFVCGFQLWTLIESANVQ